MAAATMFEGLFSDEVFTATDLNRRAGTVLDRARSRPVTISRNNEQFALLRREQAANWVSTVNRANVALALLCEAHVTISGADPTPPFSWLKVFDKEDLQHLTSEVLDAIRNTSPDQTNWESVEAVIHEWRESAVVAQAGVLDSAMYVDPPEEMTLPHPAEFVDPEGTNTETECQS